MLKRLFTSNTRIKLLKTFLMDPESEYYIRELTRKLGEQINSVRRELDNLKKVGLLRTKSKSRKKYYYVNKKFPFLEELTNIIYKAAASEQNIAKELEKLGAIKVLVLSGVFINKPTNSVDMLIVGDINREKLAAFLNSQVRTKRPVKFSVLTEEDYQYRLNCHDKFLTEIIENSENFAAIKKI